MNVSDLFSMSSSEAYSLLNEVEAELTLARRRCEEISSLPRTVQSVEIAKRLKEMYKVMWGESPPTQRRLFGDAPQPKMFGSGWSKTILSLLVKRSLAYYLLGKLENLTVTIEGQRGVGKTTYVFNSAFQAMMDVGLTDHEAFSFVKENLIFGSISGLAKHILELDEVGGWTPFIIMDDVGVHASRYWFLSGERDAMTKLAEALDVIKDVCGVLILTVPKLPKIASFLRMTNDMAAVMSKRVIVTESGTPVLAVLEWVTQRSSKTSSSRKKIWFLETVPPHAKMPNDVWDEMNALRREARRARLSELAQSELSEGEVDGATT